jgi:hypothetical protein
MRHHRLGLVVALLALVGMWGVAAQTRDISGIWNFLVDMGSVTGEPVFSFEQKGETLAGTVSSSRGTQKVAGSVKNDKVVFEFEGGRDDRTFKAVYTGTVESATGMRGTVEYTGALDGAGTWVATKKK